MSIELKISDVVQPALEFGSPGQYFDPKNGLLNSGPFDLRFGTAKKNSLQIGIVGPKEMIDKAQVWISRISNQVNPTLPQPYNIEFPGFEAAFHSTLSFNDVWIKELDEKRVTQYLEMKDSYARFEEIVNLYDEAFKAVSNRNNKPDVILCCLSDEIIKSCWSVTKYLTKIEKKLITDLKKQKETI